MGNFEKRLNALEARDTGQLPSNIRRWLGNDLTPQEQIEADRLDTSHPVFSTMREENLSAVSPEFRAWLFGPGAEMPVKAAVFGHILKQVDGRSKGLPHDLEGGADVEH